ncbi:MAG: phosphoribosylamine--glycine ligase, partial [Chloroflexi bacterium]|nr:phosphoribosylamine--glycine ligase [Chloroflexota bacterium]
PHTSVLYIAPGNGGTSGLGTNVPVAPTDVQGLLATARERKVGLTVVGPESALETGVVDAFQRAGVPIFGPSKAAACIETSKAFAKEIMLRNHVPTAQGMAFDSYEEARRFLEGHDGPIVVKADGLAAGKGVTIAMSRAEAIASLDLFMKQRVFGDAGSRVVLEEFMVGREVSVFAFTDGSRISPLVAACDYKRALDDDQGPNTGGMGSYSPPEFWDAELAREAEQRIFRPVIDALAREGRPYRGVLYGGLMLTRSGLKVVEFNARLGDPETQVVLPRLKSDLVEIAQAVSQGDLSKTAVVWDDTACVGVVMASQGYPDSYTTGYPIRGLEAAKAKGEALVFHAGTRADGEAVATSGGRVLTVVGQAPTLAEARARAYAAVQSIHFENAYFRKDIALRAIGRVS